MIVKEIQIDRNHEAIYAYLSQPKHFVGLQPLVIKVGGLSEGCNHAGQVYFDYYAVERLRFLGFIPYNNKITSRMTLLEPNYKIRQDVKAAFGIRVHQEINLIAEGLSTRVRNVVSYEAPAYLQKYVEQQIEAAHGYLVEELKRRMESKDNYEPAFN